MDTDDEMKRLKWLLIAAVITIISAFFSWRELKYAVFGKETDAKLVRMYEATEVGRRGRTYQSLAVEYAFTDPDPDGGARTETDTLDIDDARPSGPTVPVQYLSGSPGSSRLKGNTKRVWVIVFLGSLAFAGFKVFQLVRESKA